MRLKILFFLIMLSCRLNAFEFIEKSGYENLKKSFISRVKSGHSIPKEELEKAFSGLILEVTEEIIQKAWDLRASPNNMFIANEKIRELFDDSPQKKSLLETLDSIECLYHSLDEKNKDHKPIILLIEAFMNDVNIDQSLYLQSRLGIINRKIKTLNRQVLTRMSILQKINFGYLLKE